jgi:hypothetical protein
MEHSTVRLDIYAYRAALLEWHQENVGQTQRIYLAEDSSALLILQREFTLIDAVASADACDARDTPRDSSVGGT